MTIPEERWAALTGNDLVGELRLVANSFGNRTAALLRAADVIEQQARENAELRAELDDIEYSHDLDLRSARSHAEWMARED